MTSCEKQWPFSHDPRNEVSIHGRTTGCPQRGEDGRGDGSLTQWVHAWVGRGESGRSAAEQELEKEIRGIQKKAKRRYGSPRVTAALQRAGRRVGHNRVARIMKENDLQARPKRRFRVTTKADPSAVAAENLLARNFLVPEVNRVWVSDITYIPTTEVVSQGSTTLKVSTGSGQVQKDHSAFMQL